MSCVCPSVDVCSYSRSHLRVLSLSDKIFTSLIELPVTEFYSTQVCGLHFSVFVIFCLIYVQGILAKLDRLRDVADATGSARKRVRHHAVQCGLCVRMQSSMVFLPPHPSLLCGRRLLRFALYCHLHLRLSFAPMTMWGCTDRPLAALTKPHRLLRRWRKSHPRL